MSNRHAQTNPRPRRQGRPPAGRGRRAAVFAICIAVVLLLALVLGIALNGGFGPRYKPGEPPPGPPYVVALDAGHGGGDLGATGLIDEVQLTEATVGYLYELLAADDNYRPILTRKLGQGASINERTRKAASKRASLLLSVHGNADDSGAGNGFECYPAPPGRDWHAESLRFAGLLAGEMAAAGSPLRGEGGVRFLYYEGGDSAKKVFREASDTAVYDDPSFGVVENPGCPAVLAEQCFVTNAEDVARFGTDEGCRLAAQCYYRAICNYYGTPPV